MSWNIIVLIKMPAEERYRILDWQEVISDCPASLHGAKASFKDAKSADKAARDYLTKFKGAKPKLVVAQEVVP